ncbi:MAG: carbohydrate binding domain-containing protein [Ruminococcus sp.]|nr:carbohydrate binding domain-containing protein [Ruminococcus sp.]
MRKDICRKLAAGAVASLLALTSVPAGVSAADALISSSFDNGTDSWSGRGNASVAVDKENYYEGGGSLAVKGRTQSWNGAELAASASLTAGSSYSFSAAVLQTTGSVLSVKMTLDYVTGGSHSYDEIALTPVNSGEWTAVSNTSYTIPAGADSFSVYFEIPDDNADFYIDSFTVAENGAPAKVTTGGGVINGSLQSDPVPPAAPGDFDADGDVDIFDLMLARQALVKQFSGAPAGSFDIDAADVDGNGTFAVNDVVLLSKFLLGMTDSFPTRTTTTTTTVTTATNTVTTTTKVSSGGNYMESIASDMVINAPSNFTQTRAGVDYGKLEKVTYYSTDAGTNKNMQVLLPAGYNENEKYPVLYVLHGIFGDETSMPGMGVPTMVGNLIADGEAVKMIVVFPAMFTGSGSPGFTNESNRKYDLIREDIENSIMPYMEEHYSVATGRENTAITGFSMGGREALYTGISHSQYYGYVGAACPAPGIFKAHDNYMDHEGVMQPGEFKPSTMPEMILISAAQNDGVVGTFPQTYHEALEANGVQHLWQIIPQGDHGNATVDPHMYNFLRYIFKA